MIFAYKDHPQAIIDGLKTETRRRITALDRYHEGVTYAIQPKRTAKGITQGRILILKKWVELKSKDYPISVEDAYAEGCYTPEEYEKLYEKINPKWNARVAFKFEFIPYPGNPWPDIKEATLPELKHAMQDCEKETQKLNRE